MGEKLAEEEREIVTPGEVLGRAAELKAGKGTYVSADGAGVSYVYASLTGRRALLPPPPDSPDKRPIVEVTGHKAHGAVPEPGCIVLARVKKVMAKMASADIMCVGERSVREKFTGVIRQQDVRATEIDKVDMHASFRVGDIVRAVVVSLVHMVLLFLVPSHVALLGGTCIILDTFTKLSLGDARAYYLSTAKNELGVVSAESTAGLRPEMVLAGEMMIPISWTEMQCPVTGQIEQRKVAKVGN
ncbi:hypothetical protein Cgig2_015138 [Carnegiea gigantea]|uniref:Exosome complex component CSL4 n=1 Tax=Carnegiea gigantea TaxID=171969 RepID=A0A9Q1KRI9_9CARY|nr:hypothetical protein Cgig2_015138 [Carnegiea gigantea]